MINHEWPANAYAIGSFIQATVADQQLHHLQLKPTDHVLDVGCGDGAYSTKIIQKIPQGQLVGLDRSENMLALAREKQAIYPHFSLQHDDVLSMNFNEQFDWVVSFWCLQWCNDLEKAFLNIYHSLKKGGHVMALLPFGDDPFIRSYHAVKASGQFPSLEQFVSPVDYHRVHELPSLIMRLPFISAQVSRKKESILLPSLDMFRKFLNGLAFFQGQISEHEIGLINDAMVDRFAMECQNNYAGKYYFNFSIYLITAGK